MTKSGTLYRVKERFWNGYGKFEQNDFLLMLFELVNETDYVSYSFLTNKGKKVTISFNKDTPFDQYLEEAWPKP